MIEKNDGRVVVVDDHPAIRMALKLLLTQNNFIVCGEAEAGVDAIQVAKETLPDVIILDIGIPRLDGLTVIPRLKSIEPSPAILVFTSYYAENFGGRCQRAGASGFISKDQDLSLVIKGVQSLVSGYNFFPSNIDAPPPHSGRKSSDENDTKNLIDSLSDRELFVFQQLAKGRSNKEISELLLLSNKTISTYKTRLYEKLNISSIVDLIEIAKANQIVDDL